MRMSEQDKEAQIGKLALEYSAAKGELNHLVEKIMAGTKAAYILGNGTTQGQAMPAVRGGHLMLPGGGTTPQVVSGLSRLLSYEQLVATIEEKDRVQDEVAALAARLKTLAPHLVP